VSAQKGGDLGWLKEGSIDAKFSKILFGLEPAEISEPFETPFGFHIVKLADGPRIVKKPLEAVAGDIRYQLRNKAKQAELERLMKMAKIERK
jgi:peptidyl-prolyl cis-trans isomerase C